MGAGGGSAGVSSLFSLKSGLRFVCVTLPDSPKQRRVRLSGGGSEAGSRLSLKGERGRMPDFPLCIRTIKTVLWKRMQG